MLKKLLYEVTVNGKLLVAYIIQESGLLVDYPGIADALLAVAEKPSTENVLKLAFQVFFAGAAGHRALKILLKTLQ